MEHDPGKFGSPSAPIIDPGTQARIGILLGTAIRHHQAGRLSEAGAIYRQVLDLDPNNADALHLLGVVARQAGHSDQAAILISQAIALNGREPSFHNNLGNVLKQQGKLDAAAACYRRAVALKPAYAEAHSNLGNVLAEQGDLNAAMACYRQALALRPDYADAQYNLGNALRDQGDLPAAVAAYEQTLAIRPDYAEAQTNLGNVLREQGKLAAAQACYERALVLKPDFIEALSNLGNVLRDQGDLAAAMACQKRALSLRPDYADAHNNLGNVLRDLGQVDAAINCYQRALALRPNYAEAENNLGNAFRDQGEFAAAQACYERALILKPNLAEAHSNLGNIFHDQGDLTTAETCYRQALALDQNCAEVHYNLGNALRDQGQLEESAVFYENALRIEPNLVEAEVGLVQAYCQACDWVKLADHAAALLDLVRQRQDALAPFVLLTIAATPAEQLTGAATWGRKFIQRDCAGPAVTAAGAERSRLKIGYLSADFRNHPVAHVIAELIERHDRTRFEVTAYSYGADDGSATRQGLVRAFDRFVDLRLLGHQAAAERIKQDGVDILIDLQGYTKAARTEIASFRPAPVQVNFLGYPGTMGVDFIDYLIADHFVIPPGQEADYTERLVRLPHCYLPYDTRQIPAERVPLRAEYGLPAQGFVFCSFNTAYKITPAFFDIWMRLLRAIPGSVLWLKRPHPWANANLERETIARGVDKSRLIFADNCAMPDHLARHQLADLFLDSLPYNAHSTASDALWAGLPVLTCVGQSFAGRVAGSLLTAIGLPELITETLQDYEALALDLALNPARLGKIRATLRRNRMTAPLFDTACYTRNIEAAYEQMVQIYRTGHPPQPIDITEIV